MQKLPQFLAVTALALAATMAQAAPQAALSEGFDDVGGLAAAGWLQSSPPDGWFQGNAGVFAAHSGADNSYAAANYLSADASGVISNWLITPELELFGAGGNLSFWTRTEAPLGFADHLKVLFNGTGSTDLADFTTVVAEVNANEVADGYPSDWTRYSVGFASGAMLGRIAFVYTSADASTANYIGLDGVNFASVPEPGALALVALALGGLAATRRRGARQG